MSALTRERALEIAREAALTQGFTGPDYHSYLPRTREDANNFQPHDWVIDAMMRVALEDRLAAMNTGRSSLKAAVVDEPIETNDASHYETLNRPAAPDTIENAVASFLNDVAALRIKHGIPDVCVIVQARATGGGDSDDAPRCLTAKRYWGDVGAHELALLARWYGSAKQEHEDRLGDSIEAGRRMARDRRAR